MDIQGWKRLQTWLTPRRLSYLLTAVYVLSLLPLLLMAGYNYPSADDYSIGSECHQVWQATGSLSDVIQQGILQAVDDWKNWMGYFTSNYLMAVPPNAFGAEYYFLTTWLILGMLTFSTLFLVQTILNRAFGADKYLSRCVGMLLLFMTVQRMVGRVEAFYWYSGAANYMLMHGVCLFFYGLLISAAYDKGKRRIWDLAGASVLGFLAGGGNQMTALNGAVIVLTVAGLLALFRKWKAYRALAVPMISYLLGFILNVAAPGNWVRAEGAAGMHPVKAVMISFYYCLDYCMNEWSGWPVALFVIAIAALFWQMADKVRFRFPYPAAAVLFGYCLVSAMMTPPLFAVGNIEAARLQALTFTMYLLVLTFCTGYVTGWAKKKWQEAAAQPSGKKKKPEKEEGGFSQHVLAVLLLCFLFFGFASVLTVIPEPHYFTASSAITDLSNGTAKAYGEALEVRKELYENGKGQDVVVEPLPAKPVLLYFSDISSDPENWENQGLCKFYGLKSVAVSDKAKEEMK